MSRFKIYINKASNSKIEGKPNNTLAVSGKVGNKIKSTGIKSYDRTLIVKKINLLSQYIKEDKNISIDEDKVQEILSTTN